MKSKSFRLYNEPGLKNNLHEQLLNALPVMIMVTDKSDHITYMNKNFSSLIEHTSADDNISMKAIINKDDWNNWNENLFRLSNLDNKSNCVFTIRFNTGYNGIKYIKLQGKVLKRDEAFKPITYFFTGDDVTEQYKKENTAATEALNSNPSNSAEQLKHTLKDLDRSNKDLEEFAYIASHDLQEPLRKITTFSSRLQYKYGENLGDEGRLYLDKINSAAGTMKDLIENLLQVSRTAMHFHPFTQTDLNNILKEVKQNLELEIEERNAKIICENLPVIEASSSQMKQLFNNLLSNAIKFSLKDQPPLIHINADEVSLAEKKDLNLSSDKPFYKITVKDNGIGFSQDAAKDIFKIFYRLNGKSEYPGTGIGLSICNKIVQKHNGFISAESEPCKGAAFIIILPKTQDK